MHHGVIVFGVFSVDCMSMLRQQWSEENGGSAKTQTNDPMNKYSWTLFSSISSYNNYYTFHKIEHRFFSGYESRVECGINEKYIE